MSKVLENNLDLLRRLNHIKIDGKLIYDYFNFDRISIWSFLQQLIWAEINRSDSLVEGEEIKPNSVKIWLLRIFAIWVSFFSFLIFKIKKPQVLIFTEDVLSSPDKTDQRVGGVYRFLVEKKISFGEIVHTRLNRRFVSNFFKRRRPVIYLETVDFLQAASGFPRGPRFFPPIDVNSIDFSDFSESERRLAVKALKTFSQYAETSIARINFFKKIFRAFGAKRLFAIDDMRYVNELLLAARLSGVASNLFQHGRFNKYQPGWINYEIPPEKCIAPDKYFVWNNYWRNKLLRLSPTFKLNEAKVIVGGKAGFSVRSFKCIPAIDDGITTILLPYEELANPDDIRGLVGKLIQCPSTVVIFKLRGDLPVWDQLRKMKLDDIRNKNFQMLSSLTDEVLKKVDLVIGTYSTLLYEMVEAGKSIGILEMDSTQAGDLVEDGLASFIRLMEGDSLCKQVKQVANTEFDILRQNAEKLKVNVNIYQVLEKVLSG